VAFQFDVGGKPDAAVIADEIPLSAVAHKHMAPHVSGVVVILEAHWAFQSGLPKGVVHYTQEKVAN